MDVNKLVFWDLCLLISPRVPVAGDVRIQLRVFMLAFVSKVDWFGFAAYDWCGCYSPCRPRSCGSGSTTTTGMSWA